MGNPELIASLRAEPTKDESNLLGKYLYIFFLYMFPMSSQREHLHKIHPDTYDILLYYLKISMKNSKSMKNLLEN